MKSIDNFFKLIEKELVKHVDSKEDLVDFKNSNPDIAVAIEGIEGGNKWNDQIGLFDENWNEISTFDKFRLIIEKLLDNSKGQGDDISSLESMLGYLDRYSSYCNSLYQFPIDAMVENVLNENGFKATKYQRRFVGNQLKDILLFHHFIEVEQKSPLVQKTIDVLKKIISKDSLESMATLITYTKDDINKLTRVGFFGSGKIRIDLSIWDELRTTLCEKHESVDWFLSLVQSITLWDEFKTRKEVSRFIMELSNDIKLLGDPVSTKSSLIYEYLLVSKSISKPSSTKMNVVRVLFELLEPILVTFHDKEEFVKSRSHASFDKRAYTQHQRDSVLQLIGLRNRK